MISRFFLFLFLKISKNKSLQVRRPRSLMSSQKDLRCITKTVSFEAHPQPPLSTPIRSHHISAFVTLRDGRSGLAPKSPLKSSLKNPPKYFHLA